MSTLYNIYYAGQLLEGEQLETVRPRLARLFNADEQTLDRLFSGKAQLLKRDCDKATALKYKQAMEKAGALPLIRASESKGAAARPEVQPGEKTMTTAERIAALAAAAEAREAGRETTPAAGAAAAKPADGQTEGVSLAPVGADVLREDERTIMAAAVIDTGGLDLDEQGQRLSPEPPPAPPAPDTSHLEMGAVGDDIPTLPRHEAELAPDIEGLELAPSGTDFTDCAAPPAEAPQLDLSALDLAPAGSDVLEQAYRKRPPAQAPATDHLSLEE